MLIRRYLVERIAVGELTPQDGGGGIRDTAGVAGASLHAALELRGRYPAFHEKEP